MDFDLKIKKIGQLTNVFEFFRYMIDTKVFDNYCLLESVDENSQEMLFSFMGLQPDLMLKINNAESEIYDIYGEQGERLHDICSKHTFDEDKNTFKMPFEDLVPMQLPGLDELRDVFPTSKNPLPELFPRKVFSGGLLGYIGYDVVAPLASYVPSKRSQDLFPDILMGLYTNILAYSHATKTLYEISNTLNGFRSESPVSSLFRKFSSSKRGADMHQIIKNKDEFLKNAMTGQASNEDFKSNTNLDEWTAMIDETKEHIYAGDIIQTVISRKMVAKSNLDPLIIYEALRLLNPSPYMFFMNFNDAHNGDVRIIGSSPEALITKYESRLETVPIAGTRRRGRNKEDEARMAKELLNSTKERAEHIMLVDLARNDLARVSVPGSVDTYELIKLKKYPNVMHLVSKVQSTSYLDPIDVLKSVFPAGTVSGAPKKRAMEIISKQESENRGPYAGVSGYISFTGNMDMAINIRTIFNKGDMYIAQAGAGIVADSKPKEEYLETANKMKGILSTLKIGRKLESLRRNE